MLFRQLFHNESCTYTYILAADYGGEAIIIDPVLANIDLYLRLIRELNLKLNAAIDTHLHADHITAVGTLGDILNCRTMIGINSQVACASEKLQDDDLLCFDDLELKVLHTPGHTNDSCCLLLADRIFTGDTLLIRGTGRTDFQHGDPKQLYNSIFNKLLRLPDNIMVFPGHDYNGVTVSSIGEERKYNPRLQVKSCEDFVVLMNNLNLPKPKLMEIAVPANQKCGLMQKELA